MNKYSQSYKTAISKLGIIDIGHLTDIDFVNTQKGGKLSLGLECLDRDLWDFDRAYPLIKKLGVKRVRLQSGWQKTEKVKGVYDFAWLDSIIAKLASHDIETVLCLCYGNKLYCEDPKSYPSIENGGVGHIPVQTEVERNGWANYVSATVSHYKDSVKYFEIWNEADVSVFARVDMPWIQAYMSLVKLTSPIIRNIAPDATVISCTANIFKTELLVDAGIADYVDVHSFHDYKFFPEAFPPQALSNFLNRLRKKAPKLRFWRGESGCPSYNDPKSKGALSDIVATEPKQAKFLLRHLMNDLANDAIECTSYFHAYDFEHFSMTVRYHYGLIRHEDLSTKPSYDCFKVFTRIFDGKVKSCKSSELSYIKQKNGNMLTDEEFASIKFHSLEKDGYLIYAYYLPKPIEDENIAKKVVLSVPYDERINDPIILDPLTQRLYDVSYSTEQEYPITDYPLLVVDRKMIEAFSVINDKVEKSVQVQEIGQCDHE